MGSRIKAVIRFNQREAIRAKIGQYMLLILVLMFVFEEGKALMNPNVVIIENVQAQINPSLVKAEYSDKTNDTVASEGISEALAEVGEVKVASSVPDVIRQVAKEKGLDNVQGLLNLAHCESRFTPTAFNPTNKSNDRGIYQISKRWHPEVSDDVAYDPKQATEWTVERIKAGYGYEWMCFHAYNDANYITTI